ncbi:MAG: hypothetical protein H7Y03_00905 [Chitinophagaceae bacterium]|nr:hypothetical protein [Chitinophagaceae bacterium]
MRKVLFPALFLLTISIYSAHAQKIVVSDGQKFELVTLTKMDMNMEAMGTPQKVITETTIIAIVESKSHSDTDYVFVNTIKSMKLITDAAGQKINFDSDNKEDMNGPMAAGYKGIVGSTQEFRVNRQGKILSMKTLGSDSGGIVNQTLEMFSLFTKGQPYPLLMAIPAKPVKKGESWVDSTGSSDSLKTVYTYTLKENNGTDAIVGIKGLLKMAHKMAQQGMDIQMNLEGNISGDAVYEKANGLLKSNTSVSDMKGNMEVMGQSMPMTMVTTTTLNVRKI